MNTDMFYSSTFIATVITALLIWGLIALKKKNSDKNLGELINFIFLREKVTFNVVGMIFINVAEAFMAASISPPGEMPINPVARFLGHLVVALVGISLALSSMAALSKVKVAKEGKGGLVVKAMFTLGLALFVPYLNALLIASGLREVNNFAHSTHGDINGAMRHASYAMNATLIMTALHYIFFATDAIGVLSGGDHSFARSILNSFGTKEKGEGSNIDKKITNKGEEQKNKDHKILVREILTAYRIDKTEERERHIKNSIDTLDSMSAEDRAKLIFTLANLRDKIKNWQKEKDNASDQKRQEINTKIYGAIYEVWEKSTDKGQGFGTQLPKKKNLGN